MNPIKLSILATFALLIYLFPTAVWPAQGMVLQENRVALIVGVKSYLGKDREGNSNELVNSINDARAMAEKLASLGFKVLKREDMSSTELPGVLADLKSQITPGSIVALYFSGHGMQIGGRNYLLLKDSNQENIKDIEEVKRYSLALDSFIEIAKQQKAQNTFVFLDACRSNPLKSRFNTVGLAEVMAPSGSLIALSTKPGGFSWDLSGVADNSLFTKHLVRHLDKDNTPVDQVMKTVNKGVFMESKLGAERVEDIQEPWLQLSLYEDVYLRQSGPIKTFGNEQADTTFWFDIKESGDEALYHEYISQFPNGKFIIQAKNKIAGLKLVAPSTAQKILPVFEGGKQRLVDKLSSPRFLDELDQFINTSGDPMSDMETALRRNNLLARAWWCALSTHERYKFPVRSQDGVKYCASLANEGFPIGMYLMGRSHLFGRGVPQDDVKALLFFQKAAKNGSAIAQNILGDMYSEGRGVSKNLKAAFNWYMKSGTAGNSDGQNSLGVAYAYGYGVGQDIPRAAMWYQRAADQGNTWAQNNLGAMLLLGKGIPADYTKAFYLISHSSEQGNSQAWLLMGTIYESGAGQDRNITKARHWYQRAVDQASDPELKQAASEALRRISGRK